MNSQQCLSEDKAVNEIRRGGFSMGAFDSGNVKAGRCLLHCSPSALEEYFTSFGVCSVR